MKQQPTSFSSIDRIKILQDFFAYEKNYISISPPYGEELSDEIFKRYEDHFRGILPSTKHLEKVSTLVASKCFELAQYFEDYDHKVSYFVEDQISENLLHKNIQNQIVILQELELLLLTSEERPNYEALIYFPRFINLALKVFEYKQQSNFFDEQGFLDNLFERLHDYLEKIHLEMQVVQELNIKGLVLLISSFTKRKKTLKYAEPENKNITVQKIWHDETAGTSYIEGLNFSPDRIWKECKITIMGNNGNFVGAACQSFLIYLNGEKIFYENLYGTKIITRTINSDKGFSISGDMSRVGVSFKGASGYIKVECSYEESSVLRSKSVVWNDSGFGTVMEYLFLDATENWKKCELKIEGVQNAPNRYRMQLIKDGRLATQAPESGMLIGTNSDIYHYDLNGIKQTLLVSGYCQFGGGKVTLTGIY